jgi:hypothetical protein
MMWLFPRKSSAEARVHLSNTITRRDDTELRRSRLLFDTACTKIGKKCNSIFRLALRYLICLTLYKSQLSKAVLW